MTSDDIPANAGSPLNILVRTFVQGLLAIFVVVGLAANVAGESAGDFPGRAADETGLCPPVPASRRVVVANKVTTVPPANAEETAAARGRLSSSDAAARVNAAVSLALAGDLQAFEILIAAGDRHGLSAYARFYVNPDGHSCIAPEIEEVLPIYLDDATLRPTLLTFFGKNLYRRRELFNRLNQIGFDDGRPDDYVRVAMALTATRLGGVEEEVLVTAENLLVHDTPVRKRVLPAVHRVFVAFLTDRLYEPAVDYMEKLLVVEGLNEEVEYFVAGYSVTRSTVYHALDRFASPLVGDVFIRQLERVATSCPVNLVKYELAAFGEYAVRHAVTDDQRRRIADSLAVLLGLGPAAAPGLGEEPGATDYLIHKACVELLADLGTTEAAAVLVGDLERVVRVGDDGSQSGLMFASTLQALGQLPESAELDVPRFLEAVKRVAKVHQLFAVAAILDAHPDPAAHAFYLAQLEWILDPPEGSLAFQAIDPARALDGITERLLAFEEPQQLEMTRNEIDRLYLAGLLDEQRFIEMTAGLNELMGTRSAVYLELEERQRLDREAEIHRKREAEEALWLQVMDDNLSPEGIQRNLELLDSRGSGSRTAAAWLVIAGKQILPSAHPMLTDPASSAELKFSLLQVVGEIGDPSSIPPVIENIRLNLDTPGLVKAGFQALALMPPSGEALDLVDDLLGGDYSMIARQQALVYLAAIRDPKAGPFALSYSASDVEPELRIVGLLLAARLGDDSVLPTIVDLLVATEERSHREVLLRALGELSNRESYAGFSAEHPGVVGAESMRETGNLVAFRHTEGDAKIELAQQLIQSGHPWDRREAVAFLVEENHSEVLARYLRLNPIYGLPLLATVVNSPMAVPILAQIRRMGYRVEETAEGFELVRNE